VRPASAAPPSAVNDFAVGQLDGFAKEFPRWMRGDTRVKNDREVTPLDIQDYNMVVFGTPSTNPMIGRFGFDSDPLDSRFDRCGEPEI